MDQHTAWLYPYAAHGSRNLTRNYNAPLFYDARRNVFAVVTQKGAPRTLFPPYEGAAYWQKQKQIEAERGALKRDSYDSAEE